MSMYDRSPQEKLSDWAPLGNSFWLLDAKYEGIQPTTYGPGAQAVVIVCAPGDFDNQKEFRVWGELARQIEQLEVEDIPAEVYITAEGRSHVWKVVTLMPELRNQPVQRPVPQTEGQGY